MPFAELAVLVAAGDETSLPNGWEPGESSANGRLDRFLQDRLSGYARWRDRPAMDATSRLSPHLHFGELGPRQVWHAVRDAAARRRIDPLSFLRELGRREFAQHVLYHFPTSVSEPMLPTFLHFPWLSDPAGLQAWQRGMTGYPLVDAGMRELYETGFMHGRARMVTASFLVKHLLVSWREGARWFWDRSVDADLAANTFGWQLCAGSGSLEGPTFRFLNPVSQGAAFDPAGAYVRRWIPQLERLPQRFVHAPWTAPRDVLAASRLELGRDYPWPIVEPRAARARALAAFETMRVRSRARP
jgi:deoxyribodipyrimidine photo-lyase